MRLAILALSSGCLLTACQSVQDHSIPLSNAFLQNAELLLPKKPSWTLSSSSYQQDLGLYKITATNASWQSSEKSSAGINNRAVNLPDWKDGQSIWNFIVLDALQDSNQVVKHSNIQGEQNFSFSVIGANTVSLHSQCKLFWLNKEQQYLTANEQKNHTDPVDTQRAKSYLGCHIQYGEQVWQLTAATAAQQITQFSLQQSQQPTSYQVTTVTAGIQLVDQHWISTPGWLKGVAGVEFAANQQPLAALSFEGQAKIWLSKTATAAQRDLLLASSYSLLMYDWLDDQWRGSAIQVNQSTFK